MYLNACLRLRFQKIKLEPWFYPSDLDDFTANNDEFFSDDFWTEDFIPNNDENRYDQVNESFENNQRYDEVFSDEDDQNEETFGILPFPNHQKTKKLIYAIKFYA